MQAPTQEEAEQLTRLYCDLAAEEEAGDFYYKKAADFNVFSSMQCLVMAGYITQRRVDELMAEARDEYRYYLARRN